MGFRNHVILIFLTLFTCASVFAKSNKVEKRYFLGFGPGFFTNLNANGVSTLITPGMNWSLSDFFDLSLSTDVGISFKHSDVLYISPQLKGRYFFSPEEEHSYFVGIGSGYGYAKSHGDPSLPADTSKGFAMGAAFGFKAFRGADMQIAVSAEHQMIVNESRTGTPLATFIKIDVFFSKL